MAKKKRKRNNCTFELFKLHKKDNEYKVEIILEPLKENTFIDITEEDYERLKRRFWLLLESEEDGVSVYIDNLKWDFRGYHECKQVYKEIFRQYYVF